MALAPPYSNDPSEIFSARAIDDPHPLYARLRATAPVSRVGDTGVHLLTTWDGIEEVLARDREFSANLTGVLMRGDDGKPTTFDLPVSSATSVIATADDPRHAVHRDVVRPRLTAGRIADLEETIRGWAGELLHPFVKAGGGEFVDVAERIPARAVAQLLGLPLGDVELHRRWAMMGGAILAGDVHVDTLLELSSETAKMAQYLQGFLDRAPPSDAPDAPLLHGLKYAVQRGSIDRDEAVGIAIVMFGAGGESTAALLGSVVRRLAEEPDLAAALREEPGHVSAFVEEVARLEPPFKFHYRAVTSETTLGGYDVRPGDRLMLVWASANRDASRIEDPDALRLDRSHPRDHISFGRGIHFCVGAHLARLEARIVVEELLQRAALLRFPENRRPAYARSIFVRRHESLPLLA